MNSPPGGQPGPEGRDPGRSPPPGVHASPSLVGTVLAGRYRILRELGQGAMGSVYLGEHLKIGRKDAIKVLRGALAVDSESIARFERGARNLSAIRHPNVCTLYDYGETADGSPFLALEFVTGESLKDLIQRETVLAPQRAISIARQTAEALEAAHDAGIVHRDLKPANIMIERGRGGADVVKVVDFDIAKGPEGEGEELTRMGFVVGTPEYMSPEQLAGEGLDGRSDVYSLGLVLFRMLTGVLPFRGGSAQDVMIARLTYQPLRLEEASPGMGLPPALQSVLDRSLARNRTDRYARAEDMARDLAALSGSVSEISNPIAPATVTANAGTAGAERLPDTRVSTSPPPREQTGPTVATTAGGRRWLIYAIAVTAILGGAAGVFLATQGDTRSASPDDSTTMSNPNTPGVVPETTQGKLADNRPRNPDSLRISSGDSTGQAVGRRSGPEVVRQPAGEDPNTVLVRLADRLDVGTGAAAVPTAMAVGDTAVALFYKTGLADSVRASAAVLAATAFQLAGDNDKCLTWIRRALDLRPGNRSYEVMLRGCGGTQL